MPKQAVEDVQKAKRYLGGEKMPPRDVLALAKRLKGLGSQNGFRWARRVLSRARDRDRAAIAAEPNLPLKFGQEHALCTYKDPDLPALRKLHAALDILKEVDDPDGSTSDETLGQTGAIYKLLWAELGRSHTSSGPILTTARLTTKTRWGGIPAIAASTPRSCSTCCSISSCRRPGSPALRPARGRPAPGGRAYPARSRGPAGGAGERARRKRATNQLVVLGHPCRGTLRPGGAAADAGAAAPRRATPRCPARQSSYAQQRDASPALTAGLKGG